MRKIAGIAFVFLFAIMFLATVSAEEQKEGMMEHHGKKMGKGMSGKMMMMKNMMKKSMVATKDGGVIVMIGNKLLKYDKDLKLKKEVKIEMDMQEMKDMMSKCKMMTEKHRMGKGRSDECCIGERTQEME